MKFTKNKIVYEENINNIKGKAVAIVFPESIQEIKNIVKLGNNDIIARGSGTSFTGAVIPKNSIIIDFSKMNKIIEISALKKTAIVEPGVLISELNEELEEYGLEFPIQTLFSGIETIGGVISKNSSGNRELKYNRAINWVDSLEVINSKGEQQKISKSDISDFCGMEGTTGLIIKATIRLTNKKPRSITILKGNTLVDVFNVNRKLRFDPEVCSIDLLNKEVSYILGLEKKYHIFVEYDSLKGAFKNEDYQKFINLKNKAYKRTSQEGFNYITNIKFLIDSLQDFLIYLEEKGVPYFCHLGSGVVYPMFKLEQIGIIDEASKFAKKMRGRVAYNFGIGLTKKDALEIGEEQLLRRVKNRHDPHFKFNSEKLIDNKAPEISKEMLQEKKDRIKELERQIEESKEVKLNEELKTLNEKDLNLPSPDAQKTIGDILKEKENMTLKKKEELSDEEKEKIKKIASGFFSGGKK